MTTNARFLRIVAVLVLLPAQALAQPPSSPTFETMAAVAKDICARPTMYGYTKTTQGGLGGALSLPGLLKKLLNVGVKADARATNINWSGVLQADAAKSLADANKCAQDMFKTMVQHLDVKPDQSTENKPQRLLAGQNDILSKPVYRANGLGPAYDPPKLNGRTLDGCMIKPENPGGDACTAQDTQNIAARFCESAGFLSSKTFRSEDTGQFQASLKLTKKVAADRSWHFVWNPDDSGGYIISHVECRK